MKSLTFKVSDVPLATEPYAEMPYHEAIKRFLGLPLLDKQQSLQKVQAEIDELTSSRQLPGRINEMLAESKQKLAAAEASEATITDDLEREAVRKKKQIFQKQIDMYGTDVAENKVRSAAYKIRRMQMLKEELAEIEAREFSTDQIEACSRYHGRLVARVHEHPVLGALALAFNGHHPFSLSPDMIWLLICQGVAQHVNIHAESLRSKFVQHAEQVTIEVRRDDFFKGSPENPWGEMIDELCLRVREHIGSAHDLFMPQFSTTGPTERIAAEIVLLDAVQSYFKYEFTSRCGIPAITLEGTAEDWQALADRVEAFAEFDLEWWLTPLRPILQELVATAKGIYRGAFWKSIYKYESMSGGDIISGWIVAFFPYLKDKQNNQMVKNRWLAEGGNALKLLMAAKLNKAKFPFGPRIKGFPNCMSRVPFIWNYRSQCFDMELLGGFVGVAQDETTLTLRPEIGWAIRQINIR